MLVAACGGGGGAATPPPVRQAAALAAPATEFAPTATTAWLELQLTGELDGAVLAEATLELPDGVVLAPSGGATARQPLATLDAHAAGTSIRVLAGDAKNASAAALQPGALLAIPLAITLPRRTGTQQATLRDLRLARADGSAVPVQNAPVAVTVTIR